MTTFHIITIFPEAIEKYFDASLLKKARDKKIIKINLYNLRDFSVGKHKQVDDRPFAGGPGMVLKIEPIFKAVKKIKSKIRKKDSKIRTILLSLGGKVFNQKRAGALSKYNHIILICGHYEGIDERVSKYIADEEISLGNFVLSGGEIPALAIVESISRLLPNFMGNIESLEGKRAKRMGEKLISVPSYTRPEIFHPNSKNKKVAWKVPKVLLSGHHKKIDEWRKKNIRVIN